MHLKAAVPDCNRFAGFLASEVDRCCLDYLHSFGKIDCEFAGDATLFPEPEDQAVSVGIFSKGSNGHPFAGEDYARLCGWQNTGFAG